MKQYLFSSPKTTIIIFNLEDSDRICQAVAKMDDCDPEDITVTQLKDSTPEFDTTSLLPALEQLNIVRVLESIKEESAK